MDKNSDKRGLDAIVEQTRATGERGPPPVHLWNPPSCGDIDIVIGADGLWRHEGSPIGRSELVRLFSTILRRDDDGYWLVTPVEKMRVAVEDLPFRAVRVDRLGEDLEFLTDVGDRVRAGPDHPIRIEAGFTAGEPRPAVHVRRGLWARIVRPVFYELAAMALAETDGNSAPAVRSGGVVYSLEPHA